MLGGSEICYATDRASFRCSYVLNVIPQAMVQSVAIIGAGNMGSGIAQKSATEGFSVQMVDREEQWVDKGKDTIDKFLQEALERRIFRPDQAEGIISMSGARMSLLRFSLLARSRSCRQVLKPARQNRHCDGSAQIDRREGVGMPNPVWSIESKSKER